MRVAAPSPLWRTVHLLERTLGDRLDGAVRTDAFTLALGAGLRMQAEARRQVERSSRRALHLLNLPAAGDVAALRRQLGELDRELRAVRLQLELERDERTREPVA